MTQLNLFKAVDTGATFSDCRDYRYMLWRQWGEGKTICALMLNPSTADEVVNDPTVERLECRAKKLTGYGKLIVVNIFAYRATNPESMKRAIDPIGPENDQTILNAIRQSEIVICGWGNHGSHNNRCQKIKDLPLTSKARKARSFTAWMDSADG